MKLTKGEPLHKLLTEIVNLIELTPADRGELERLLEAATKNHLEEIAEEFDIDEELK